MRQSISCPSGIDWGLTVRCGAIVGFLIEPVACKGVGDSGEFRLLELVFDGIIESLMNSIWSAHISASFDILPWINKEVLATYWSSENLL